MAFHLGFELPVKQKLDADQPGLTPGEVSIIKKQIRKNAEIIQSYIERIDLFVNQEKYPKKEEMLALTRPVPMARKARPA